jgi:hypothetical protein
MGQSGHLNRQYQDDRIQQMILMANKKITNYHRQLMKNEEIQKENQKMLNQLVMISSGRSKKILSN